MSDHATIEEGRRYLCDAAFVVLNYVREDQTPIARSLGSFSLDGDDLFFSTAKDAAKVREIARHPRVSVFVEHDGQSLDGWKNLLLAGDAELIVPGAPEHARAVGLLSAKSPRFKDRVERGELGAVAVFRVRIREYQYLDFGRGRLPARFDVA